MNKIVLGTHSTNQYFIFWNSFWINGCVAGYLDFFFQLLDINQTIDNLQILTRINSVPKLYQKISCHLPFNPVTFFFKSISTGKINANGKNMKMNSRWCYYMYCKKVPISGIQPLTGSQKLSLHWHICEHLLPKCGYVQISMQFWPYDPSQSERVRYNRNIATRNCQCYFSSKSEWRLFVYLIINVNIFCKEK